LTETSIMGSPQHDRDDSIEVWQGAVAAQKSGESYVCATLAKHENTTADCRIR
jgi:hypothetical protein